MCNCNKKQNPAQKQPQYDIFFFCPSHLSVIFPHNVHFLCDNCRKAGNFLYIQRPEIPPAAALRWASFPRQPSLKASCDPSDFPINLLSDCGGQLTLYELLPVGRTVTSVTTRNPKPQVHSEFCNNKSAGLVQSVLKVQNYNASYCAGGHTVSQVQYSGKAVSLHPIEPQSCVKFAVWMGLLSYQSSVKTNGGFLFLLVLCVRFVPSRSIGVELNLDVFNLDRTFSHYCRAEQGCSHQSNMFP